MGIDFHVGDHYVSFHVPVLVLVVVALLAFSGAWKLGRFVFAAFTG